MESNDSPEIPDIGETSEEPGLPSGRQTEGKKRRSRRRVRINAKTKQQQQKQEGREKN